MAKRKIYLQTTYVYLKQFMLKKFKTVSKKI